MNKMRFIFLCLHFTSKVATFSFIFLILLLIQIVSIGQLFGWNDLKFHGIHFSILVFVPTTLLFMYKCVTVSSPYEKYLK